MAEEIKFTKKELDQINEFQGQYTQVRNDFGDVHMNRINLENQMKELDSVEAKLSDNLQKIRLEERKFLDELNGKYGEGNLDPQTGVFTPNKS